MDATDADAASKGYLTADTTNVSEPTLEQKFLTIITGAASDTAVRVMTLEKALEVLGYGVPFGNDEGLRYAVAHPQDNTMDIAIKVLNDNVDNDIRAAFQLGEFYYYGKDPDKYYTDNDPDLAVDLFERTIEHWEKAKDKEKHNALTQKALSRAMNMCDIGLACYTREGHNQYVGFAPDEDRYYKLVFKYAKFNLDERVKLSRIPSLEGRYIEVFGKHDDFNQFGFKVGDYINDFREHFYKRGEPLPVDAAFWESVELGNLEVDKLTMLQVLEPVIQRIREIEGVNKKRQLGEIEKIQAIFMQESSCSGKQSKGKRKKKKKSGSNKQQKLVEMQSQCAAIKKKNMLTQKERTELDSNMRRLITIDRTRLDVNKYTFQKCKEIVIKLKNLLQKFRKMPLQTLVERIEKTR